MGLTLQKTCLFQASQPSGSAQIRNSWNEPAQIRTNWLCPEMGHPKSGQTDFVLRWASPNQDKLSLAWNGPAQIRTNWFWLEMGQPKSGQTDFGLKWASPNQDKLILAWNVAARGLKGLKQAGFLEVSPSLSSHFSCSRQCLCTWHGYFEKKSD